MAEPILSNKDLDQLISSLNYVPGEGLENAPIPAAADDGSGAKKTAFATYIEMDAGVAGRGIQPMRVTETTGLGQPDYPDAAAGSFGIHNLELIIGNDDRKRVSTPLSSPWRKIAGLVITSQSGSEYAGTAWFIGRRVLVTAGHCLFLHDAGGFAKHIDVVPCWHNNTKPFGSYRTSFYKASNGWVNDRIRSTTR
jgi:V8-like Glu-specific endopeptidase